MTVASVFLSALSFPSLRGPDLTANSTDFSLSLGPNPSLGLCQLPALRLALAEPPLLSSFLPTARPLVPPLVFNTFNFFFTLLVRGACHSPSGSLGGVDGFVLLRAATLFAARPPPRAPRFDLPGPLESSLVSPGEPPLGNTFSVSARPSFSAPRSAAAVGDVSSSSTTPASSSTRAICDARPSSLASSFILALETSTSRGNHFGASARKHAEASINIESENDSDGATVTVLAAAAAGPHTGATSGSTTCPTCSRPYSVGRRK